MAQVHIPPQTKCTHCAAQIPASSTFCLECGSDLRILPTSPQQPAPLPSPARPRNQYLGLLWMLGIVVFTLVMYAGSATYRNVEQARAAADSRKALEAMQKSLSSLPSLPSLPKNLVGPDEKKSPITESERMERQLALDTYEKAKRDYEQAQQDAAQPGNTLGNASLEMAKSMFEMAEMSKRQSDIEWQRRLESVQ